MDKIAYEPESRAVALGPILIIPPIRPTWTPSATTIKPNQTTIRPTTTFKPIQTTIVPNTTSLQPIMLNNTNSQTNKTNNVTSTQTTSVPNSTDNSQWFAGIGASLCCLSVIGAGFYYFQNKESVNEITSDLSSTF
jgi:hypothetical protein